MQKDTGDIPISEPHQKPGTFQYMVSIARRSWLVAAVIIAAFLGALIYNLLFPAPIPISQPEIDASIASAIASATPPAAYSAQIYQTILPSFVLIQTKREKSQEEGQVGVGGGVVINASGDILTALHVVEDASLIELFFSDGTQVGAEMTASEPENDIAVLHPNQPPELIVPAVLGNPNSMRIGDEAFAVGNPLGLTGSLSAGVISGFNRSFTIDESGLQLKGLIQFDAAVNPGNSGGPLLNRYGQVIGIVTALANPSEQDSFTGIGFAVPIQVAGGAAGVPEY
jgi:S1-C subfamily serine protease